MSEATVVTILAVRGDATAAEVVPVADLPAQVAAAKERHGKTRLWVDIGGPMDDTALAIVRDTFQFHPLAVEECFGARAHPKIDEYDGYVYIITHGLTPASTPDEPQTMELDAFVGAHYLVTYHASGSRSVAAILEMVRRGPDLLRRGPAAVLHAIIERQVEGIEPVIDGIDERIAELEERAVARPCREDLALLLSMRRSILALRRWLSRQRDVVARLARNELPVGGPQEALQFRDVYDHLQRFTDLLENYRELTTSIQDVSLTVTGNRLNETMKFLTIFTSVLMPLTVITGLYGMNFEHMPELHWRWGYPLVLAVMALTAAGVLLYFRRRGWLGGERALAPPPDAYLSPAARKAPAGDAPPRDLTG
jgi:magnesium transporter